MNELQVQVLDTEDIESEVTEVTLEDIVEALTETVFGDDETITPYKVHKIVNGAFEAMESDLRIPPQMMYNYDRNGMIAKGKKGAKAYNKDEVKAFALKYTNKKLNK
jgi:hypothetical protein